MLHFSMQVNACILPSVQIASQQPRTTRRAHCSADELIQHLLRHSELAVLSLLQCTQATTALDFARCIHIMRSTLAPNIVQQQFYFTEGWRVRYKHMDASLQHMVASCSASAQELASALRKHYQPAQMIQHMLDIIGPARSAAANALHQSCC